MSVPEVPILMHRCFFLLEVPTVHNTKVTIIYSNWYFGEKDLEIHQTKFALSFDLCKEDYTAKKGRLPQELLHFVTQEEMEDEDSLHVMKLDAHNKPKMPPVFCDRESDWLVIEKVGTYCRLSRDVAHFTYSLSGTYLVPKTTRLSQLFKNYYSPEGYNCLIILRTDIWPCVLPHLELSVSDLETHFETEMGQLEIRIQSPSIQDMYPRLLLQKGLMDTSILNGSNILWQGSLKLMDATTEIEPKIWICSPGRFNATQRAQASQILAMLPQNLTCVIGNPEFSQAIIRHSRRIKTENLTLVLNVINAPLDDMEPPDVTLVSEMLIPYKHQKKWAVLMLRFDPFHCSLTLHLPTKDHVYLSTEEFKDFFGSQLKGIKPIGNGALAKQPSLVTVIRARMDYAMVFGVIYSHDDHVTTLSLGTPTNPNGTHSAFLLNDGMDELCKKFQMAETYPMDLQIDDPGVLTWQGQGKKNVYIAFVDTIRDKIRRESLEDIVKYKYGMHLSDKCFLVKCSPNSGAWTFEAIFMGEWDRNLLAQAICVKKTCFDQPKPVTNVKKDKTKKSKGGDFESEMKQNLKKFFGGAPAPEKNKTSAKEAAPKATKDDEKRKLTDVKAVLDEARRVGKKVENQRKTELLKGDFKPDVCQKCRNEEYDMSTCKSCKITHYCSLDCLHQDWVLHQRNCDRIQREQLLDLYRNVTKLQLRVM